MINFLFAIITVSFYLSFMTDGGIGNGSAGFLPNKGEEKIYGRLAETKNKGMFSDGALLGRCYEKQNEYNRIYSVIYEMKEFDSGKCTNYLIYKSQSGGQAIIYSLFGKYGTSVLFRSLCALFLAAVLTSWLLWVYKYFGLYTALFTFFVILSLRGLMMFGDNIGLVLGANYLILVMLFWAYENKNIYRLELTVFFVMFLKFFINGAEFIFAVLLLPFIPLVFNAIYRHMAFEKILKDMLLICEGITAACLLALAILLFQITRVDSITNAISYFIERCLSRTYVPAFDEGPTYFVNMKTPIVMVLNKYINFTAINIGSYSISIKALIFCFIICSIPILFLNFLKRQEALYALMVATWISFLCPLIWIVFAKGHSAIHMYLDPIVWHLPFTLLGIALAIEVIKQICIEVVKKLYLIK